MAACRIVVAERCLQRALFSLFTQRRSHGARQPKERRLRNVIDGTGSRDERGDIVGGRCGCENDGRAGTNLMHDARDGTTVEIGEGHIGDDDVRRKRRERRLQFGVIGGDANLARNAGAMQLHACPIRIATAAVHDEDVGRLCAGFDDVLAERRNGHVVPPFQGSIAGEKTLWQERAATEECSFPIACALCGDQLRAPQKTPSSCSTSCMRRVRSEHNACKGILTIRPPRRAAASMHAVRRHSMPQRGARHRRAVRRDRARTASASGARDVRQKKTPARARR